MVIRDTQSSRKVDINGYRGVFFLTFGFKDAQSSLLFRHITREAEYDSTVSRMSSQTP